MKEGGGKRKEHGRKEEGMEGRGAVLLRITVPPAVEKVTLGVWVQFPLRNPEKHDAIGRNKSRSEGKEGR